MQRPTSHLMDCRLIDKQRLNDRYVLLIVETPLSISHALPGQFAQIRIDGSPTTYLRRPISLCQVINERELHLLVQEVGDGTKTLCALEPGATVNMILPLGKGYSMPSSPSICLLIGGGVGVAPLLMQGRRLAQAGHQVHFLLGGRTSTDLVMRASFEAFGTVNYTTEDGSLGEKGFVTQHSLLQQLNPGFVYTCGPKPMMQAVAAYAKQHHVPCEVSLENLMACGIGACLCCVEDTVNGHICTCTEGPVFNIEMLKW